ncbi:MAG: tryptophan synthase beta subunit-like PLP-dependent enzyme [Olpidium bornovanus]|uniref:cysteine synthase n=1 Tax=Olpidium bornovanus TaxID=278681 RepID=A0A8H8DG74_9FUNG|nr:MAG: tryptophan synthase beta subunit-like PLP-dependent enzyme [Olpidium bornovanus]
MAEDVKLSDEQLRDIREALAVLSSKSAVESERQRLAEIIEVREDYKEVCLDVWSFALVLKLRSDDIEELKNAERTESKASTRLGARLEKLIQKLDIELRQYNTEVGSRVDLALVNQDGQVSVEELEKALKLVRHNPQDDRIRAIAQKLDKDGDGLVFLKDLQEIAQEAEGHGVVVEKNEFYHYGPKQKPTSKPQGPNSLFEIIRYWRHHYKGIKNTNGNYFAVSFYKREMLRFQHPKGRFSTFTKFFLHLEFLFHIDAGHVRRLRSRARRRAVLRKNRGREAGKELATPRGRTDMALATALSDSLRLAGPYRLRPALVGLAAGWLSAACLFALRALVASARGDRRRHGGGQGRPSTHGKFRGRRGGGASGVVDGLAETVGNTPLVRIRSLSEATGCEILAKAEMLNPGGSSKDRVAIAVVEEAERRGMLVRGRGDVLCEGTVGSTGISLTIVAKAKGYKCHIYPGHFVRLAQRRADELNAAAESSADPARAPHAVFCDQFENLANVRAHLTTTAPEIFSQTSDLGPFHALVLGAGTGGTIAGCARYLKPRVPGLRIFLADPQGSGLYHRVKHGVMFSNYEREGTRRRHQVDTVVEGVGITRITRNMATALDACNSRSSDADEAVFAAEHCDDVAEQVPQAAGWSRWIDDAVKVTDQEAVEMSRFLVREDGWFLAFQVSLPASRWPIVY